MGIDKYSFKYLVLDIFDESKTTKEMDLKYIDMQHTVYTLYKQSRALLILDIEEARRKQ